MKSFMFLVHSFRHPSYKFPILTSQGENCFWRWVAIIISGDLFPSFPLPYHPSCNELSAACL